MSTFELGPIRPPSEAESILIRFTRNCPWTKCAFCHSYKNTKFTLRSEDEIRADIDAIADLTEEIGSRIKPAGRFDRNELINAVKKTAAEKNIPVELADMAAFWYVTGMKSVFLQDADSLVMKADQAARLITHIKKRFPSVERITTYARSKTLSVKPVDDLLKIREAGLSRIHIGMESGSDETLKIINKGVTAGEHITAGQKVVEAGFELSEYYMPGAGGGDRIEVNAQETADVINSINPHFVRVRSVVPIPGTPLHNMMLEGKWKSPSEDEKVKEIRIFVSHLKDVRSSIESDHIMNLLEDISGKMPGDKDNLLSIIDSYLESSEDIRTSYILARRLGLVRYFNGFRPDSKVESIKSELLGRFGTVDAAVAHILQNYI